MPYSNVVPLPAWESCPWDRRVFPLSFEQFCLVDNRREWISRDSVNGFTILQFPRAAVICSPCGQVICNAVANSDLSALLDIYEEEPLMAAS